jgi:beta-glucanase (GH16 family)
MLGNDIDSIPNAVGWPACGEIDIMEYIGAKDPATIYGTVHGPRASSSTTEIHQGSKIEAPAGKNWYDDFHTYAVEWAQNSIKFSVDDAQYVEVTPSSMPADSRWVFQHPFFLILNVAVGGNWPGYPDNTTQFPATMLVDYVRVYQKQ